MDVPDVMTRQYEYFDPIYLLPESGQEWWREQMAREGRRCRRTRVSSGVGR